MSAPADANFIPRMEISNSGRLLGGFTALYELNATSSGWIQVSPSFGQNIDRITIDPTDEAIIYVTINNTLRRSTDGGQTFTIVNSFSSNINSVAVNSNDNDIIYIALGGTNGNIFRGTFTGNTLSLENITGALPNIPKLVVKHQSGNPDNPLFLGTSLGVWRYDNVSQDWQTYDNNLPNVPVEDLEISVDEGLITAGTFGRGVWQSAITTEPLSISDFSNNVFSVFPNPSKDLFNLSWATPSVQGQINIYDNIGSKILSEDIPQGNTSYSIDMKKISSGIYFVELVLDTIKTTQKIIKQ